MNSVPSATGITLLSGAGGSGRTSAAIGPASAQPLSLLAAAICNSTISDGGFIYLDANKGNIDFRTENSPQRLIARARHLILSEYPMLQNATHSNGLLQTVTYGDDN